MSNRNHRIYVGATTDLVGRVRQHKEKTFPNAFTARYNFYRLVYFEALPTYEAALRREKQVKRWTRAKRVALIESKNPWWHDLSES
ncbi:MAG: GIY-YIG nuclease family protein, partial [Thermoanaerobaculia bacterium]